ncbi:helix-turn-helix domain-containing protein [Streptomyces sp. NPDC058067]|uniref:helix-turn-helix domain-containing protein n=1 Tax=Streptomyces sp. NPDC058067 TaxID=3346324 RepID=UPI0036E7B685
MGETRQMPPRHFDRERVRALRRARNITLNAVAQALGVGLSTATGWELGTTVPDGEKLPAMASFYGKPLDDLFPRSVGELPDLADLRCDAGYSQYQTKELIGTKSAGPVANAERGKRRLSERFHRPLAAGYKVTVEELLAAQERSFGYAAPAPAASRDTPRTAAEKITYLLEHSYPGAQVPPSDAEIAEAVNKHAGAQVTAEDDVRAFRTGTEPVLPPIVGEGMAELFGVSPMYFQTDDTVTRQVVEGLRLLAAARKGSVGRIEARGLGPEGLSEDVLAFVNRVVEELAGQDNPGVDRRGSEKGPSSRR